MSISRLLKRVIFMVRQAHHERKNRMIAVPVPFALSLSKGRRSAFQHPIRQRLGWWLAAAMLVAAGLAMPGMAETAGAQPSEMETLIRARIEIGEAMGRYMKEQGGGGRAPEDYNKMAGEINTMVDEILSSHGLTVQEYRARSAVVLADDAAVNAFLDQHPELKARYKALPSHPSGRGPGGGGH